MSTTILKVWGGLLLAPPGFGADRRQVRVIVATRSKVAARRAIEEQTRCRMSAGEFNNYWSDSESSADLAAAAEHPEGTVLWTPDQFGERDYRPWVEES